MNHEPLNCVAKNKWDTAVRRYNICDRQRIFRKMYVKCTARRSTSTDISVGSQTTRHWVNSVSDIYGPDEIEELLEDLQVKIN